MNDMNNEWNRQGRTLSDKTACEEYGLTRDEIFRAVRAGKLQCREASMHGNPWLRLLRREIEAFVRKKHGGRHLNDQKAKAEVSRIDRELRQIKIRSKALEKRRSELQGL
jgi:hypothetical protein